MQGAEGGVDQFAVVGALVEIEQRPFECLEQLAGFLAKDLGRDPATLMHRTSLLTTASSWSGLNGLVIQPVAPALLASCLSASLDSVVRNTIGTPG